MFCTNCGKRISDRVSPPAAAVVTPAAAQPLGATLHDAHGSSRRDLPPSGELVAHGDPRATGPVVQRGCPHCRAPVQPGASFCRECGTPLDARSSRDSQSLEARAPAQGSFDATQTEPQPLPAAATCSRCHAARDPGAAFCRYCGASFVETSHAPRVTPPLSAPVGPHAVAVAARLVTLLKDGSEGRSIPLAEADADVGASEGSVTFPDDPYMSARHARVSFRAGTYTLRDLDSVNGVYVRLREETELRDRDMLLIGQQVLRFEVLGDGELSFGPGWQRGVLVFGTPEAARFARLVQYTTEGVARDVHYLFRDETVIGRENGDIVFTDDPFLSRRHAAVRVDHVRRRYTLHDLGSSNGTALRIRGEHVLRDGDQFRIGRHLFRYEAGPVGGRAGR